MRGQMLLRLVLGVIAVIALVWFISSFFVLEDENPRGTLAGPVYAASGPATVAA